MSTGRRPGRGAAGVVLLAGPPAASPGRPQHLVLRRAQILEQVPARHRGHGGHVVLPCVWPGAGPGDPEEHRSGEHYSVPSYTVHCIVNSVHSQPEGRRDQAHVLEDTVPVRGRRSRRQAVTGGAGLRWPALGPATHGRTPRRHYTVAQADTEHCSAELNSVHEGVPGSHCIVNRVHSQPKAGGTRSFSLSGRSAGPTRTSVAGLLRLTVRLRLQPPWAHGASSCSGLGRVAGGQKGQDLADGAFPAGEVQIAAGQ